MSKKYIIITALVVMLIAVGWTVHVAASTSTSGSGAETTLDHKLIARYLHAQADFVEKTNTLRQPVLKVVAEMVTDCESKKLGKVIRLDQDGFPACAGLVPTPTLPPVAPPAVSPPSQPKPK